MLSNRRMQTRRILLACAITAALAAIIPAASAQIDPGQQAQQDAATAQQAAQQGYDMAAQAAQQASQSAMQQAQQAAASSSSAPFPRSRYGRADKPTLSPHPGKFHGPVHVTLSDPHTPKAEIFYTLNGSRPTPASTRYTGPILISKTTKLRAIARSPIYSPSRVSNARYVIR